MFAISAGAGLGGGTRENGIIDGCIKAFIGHVQEGNHCEPVL
jgi:hypothetical protein